MSNFDDLLKRYEPPTETDIFIPGKVGTVDKGGAAAPATATPAGKPSDSQSTATGPEPELPEGSDPDEPEQAEDEPEESPETSSEPEDTVAESDPGEDGSPDADDGTESGNDVVVAPRPVEPIIIPRKGGGLTFEGPSVNIKYFPRALVEEMRDLLRPSLGEDFARDLSQFSLVTAFVIAAMGADIVTDEFTAHAVEAFRAADPRTDAIDKRTELLLDGQSKQDETLKKVMKKLGSLDETLAAVEMAQAYALAERTAQLDTAGATPETIEVTQKRAVASRDNIRKKVAALRRDEKIQAGRPIR